MFMRISSTLMGALERELTWTGQSDFSESRARSSASHLFVEGAIFVGVQFTGAGAAAGMEN